MGAIFDGSCYCGVHMVDTEDDIVSNDPVGSDRQLTTLVSVEFARL